MRASRRGSADVTVPTLLTEADAAQIIGCDERHVRTLPIPFLRIGKAIRYLPDDVDEWFANNKGYEFPELPPQKTKRAPTFEEALELHPIVTEINGLIIPAHKVTGYIYFIACGTPHLKIGYAEDVAKRITELQTGNPEELFVVAARHGSRKLEAFLHANFAKIKCRREWFHLTDELRDFIGRFSQKQCENVIKANAKFIPLEEYRP